MGIDQGRLFIYVPLLSSFSYQNVRGLRTKPDVPSSSIQNEEYPIIILTEKWLYKRINSSFFCRDRLVIQTNKTSDGGLLIAVYKSILAYDI